MNDARHAAQSARAALAGGEPTLVLVPSSERGWLGGSGLVAWGGAVEGPCTLEAAGAALEAAFEGVAPTTAALVAYDGTARIVRFDRTELTSAEELADACSQGALPADAPLIPGAVSDTDAIAYRLGIEEVRERIAAGDVYVLNLTRRLAGRLVCDVSQAFATLLARAGSDMSALLALDAETAVVSASPERFLRVRAQSDERLADIEPIKGTAPRFASSRADIAAASDLRCDEKELAEHVMVVDLERNDLGRVCVPGTIAVDPLYDIVATPYCHQMVSTVRGTLRRDATIADALSATFPCGSVTGAPKVAAMRIAAELEVSPRGAYCGALLVAVRGQLDSSVLIRTLEVEGGSAAWGTGAGITFESDASAEWVETELKAAPALGDTLPVVALRETCRVVAGRVPLLERHLARLASGGCGASVVSRVREEVSAALTSARDEPRLSITVQADGSVEANLGRAASSLEVSGGPTIALVNVDAPPGLPPGAAKPADRSVWDEAQARACEAGADQAVLVGPDGAILDGATSTLWLRVGDELLTPQAPPALAGVARGVVFERAGRLGLSAREAVLTRADVERADEVLLSNAYGGVVGVRGRSGSTAAGLDALLWPDS